MEIRTHGFGQYTAGEYHMAAWDADRFNPNLPVVIVCHGHGSFGWYMAIDGYGGALCHAMTEAGFLFMSVDAGGPTEWGNSTALAAVTAAVTYARTTYGVKPTKAHLYGFSMGGMTVLNYAQKFTSNVYSVMAVCPATDLVYFHGVSPYNLEIEAMYGGAGSWNTNGVVGGYSPLQAATGGTYQSTIPVKIWFAEDDPVAPASTVKAFRAVAPANVYVKSVGSPGIGHSPENADPSEAVSWLLDHNPAWN